MTRYKPKAKKLRLAKLRRRTKWAPFWTIPKVFGVGKKMHPFATTKVKRHWRRTKTKA